MNNRTIIKAEISNNKTVFKDILGFLHYHGFKSNAKKGRIDDRDNYLFISLEDKTYYTAKFSGGDSIPLVTVGTAFDKILKQMEKEIKEVERELTFPEEEDGEISGDGPLYLDSSEGPSPFKVDKNRDTYAYTEYLKATPKDTTMSDDDDGSGFDNDDPQIQIVFPDNSYREPDPRLISLNEAIAALEKEKEEHLKNRKIKLSLGYEIIKGETYVSIATKGDKMLAIKESILLSPGGNKTFNWFDV